MRKFGIMEVFLFFGYSLLFFVTRNLSVSHWLLSSGLRFAALLFLPYRCWPIIFAADCMGSLYYRGDKLESYGPLWLAWVVVLPPAATALPVYVMRRLRWMSADLSLSRMASALLQASGSAAVLAALVSTTAMKLVTYSPSVQKLPESPFFFFCDFTLGNYLGILMVVPFVMTIAIYRKREFRPLLSEFSLTSVPQIKGLACASTIIAALLLCNLANTSTEAQRLTGILMFAPAIWLTFRQGWIGAVPITIIANLALRVTTRQVRSADLLEVQELMALVASAMLILGATITEFRIRARVFARESNEHRVLARSNLQWGEEHVRRCTSVLETALESFQRHADGAIENIRYVQGSMAHAAVRWNGASVVRHDLRQSIAAIELAPLHGKGIRLALASGAIAKELNDAGISYGARVPLDAYQLPDDMQVMLYRLSYELATTLAHEYCASRISIRLRMSTKGRTTAALVVKAWPGTGNAPRLPKSCLSLKDIQGVAQTYGGLFHDGRDRQYPSLSLFLRDS